MNRILALSGVISLGLFAAGCAQVQQLEANLASPTTTQAAQNVASFVNAFECFSAGVSGAVNAGLTAGNAKGQTASLVAYTISAALCQTKFGGTVGAAVAVPASSVVTR
jgi:hypothetical protein